MTCANKTNFNKMKELITKLVILLAIVTTSSVIFAHTDGGIKVKNAWVREAPPVSPVLAAYMTIENHTGKTKELTTVTSSAFQKIEIHFTVHKDGMASMEKQDKLPIDAEGKVELKPGGTHLMLINPTKPLKAGDSVSFTLNFSDGSKTIISTKVKKGRGSNPGHHHNHEKQDKDHHGGEHHDNGPHKKDHNKDEHHGHNH